MTVNTGAFKLLIYMGKAPQHRLHAACRGHLPAFSEEVLQFLIVQRINLLERKATILKRGQVLLNGIPGCISLGSYRHDAAPICVHPYYLSDLTHTNRSVGHAFGGYVKPRKDGCFYSISCSFGVVSLARNAWSLSAGIRWSISAVYPSLASWIITPILKNS